MSITIEVSDEGLARLETAAKREGVTVDAVVQRLIEQLPAEGKAPNRTVLAILDYLEEQHKDRPYSDGSDTQRLIREARSGAMYGFDPPE